MKGQDTLSFLCQVQLRMLKTLRKVLTSFKGMDKSFSTFKSGGAKNFGNCGLVFLLFFDPSDLEHGVIELRHNPYCNILSY